MQRTLIALLLASAGGTACDSKPERQDPPIRFLHTFGVEETELFHQTIAEVDAMAVESTLVPFARGQQVIGEILRDGVDCPELIRIDATWLAVLAPHLAPVPAELVGLDWTPEAAELVSPHRTTGQQHLAVPQSVDGLVVVRDRATPAPASPALHDLISAVRAVPPRGAALGLRSDGYWLVPWLRAEGVELALEGPGGSGSDPAALSFEDEGAVRALAKFSAVFSELAARPGAAGSEPRDELRRWNAGELGYWLTGPWQLAALADRNRVAVSALTGAPRGGQLLVVPRCARRPAEGWRLAAVLVDVDIEIAFATAFGTVPTRLAAVSRAPQLARELEAALKTAEPLPRDPRTPLLFDDLNPAVAAVIGNDATPEEAIAGVRRAWRRLASFVPRSPP